MKGWICYPVWGLAMAPNNIGLDRPIFGDATIVPPTFLHQYAPSHSVTAALFAGAGLRQVLSTGPKPYEGPAPLDQLIDLAPAAFIAVRRRDPDDAARYAESIRALLTGTYVLTSGLVKGFAGSPLPLHWSSVQSRVQLDERGHLQADFRMVVSNFVHLIPLQVTHEELHASWNNGTPISGTWKLHKDHALSKVLVGDWKSLGGLAKRVRTAASTLTRAMESTDSTMSTLFGVVALESLLKGAADFKEMESMAQCIFEGPNGSAEVARLFSNRHKVAHEAKEPTGGAHVHELGVTWAIILMAAHACDHLGGADEFIAHLRGRILAARVAANMRELGNPEVAAQVESTSKMFAKTKSRGNA